jgi:ABC-type transport system involved in multi-copper enzyme maturation permease subunit
MSTAVVNARPYGKWARQLKQLVRMDYPYHFFTRRSIWLYLLAFAPVAISAIYASVQLYRGPFNTLGNEVFSFAGTMQLLYLRFLVFFGCLAVGTFLVRGEVLSKTLHYYYLASIRREVFYLSRFFVGWIATSTVFSLSVTATYILALGHRGSQFWNFFWQGQGLANLLDYLLMTVLACAGYGAIFLLASLYVKNPLIPGAAVFAWESASPVLPLWMQKFTVVYYLKSLSPVDVPVTGVLALLVSPLEPVPRWISVLGLLALVLLALAAGAWRIRRNEIDYSD